MTTRLPADESTRTRLQDAQKAEVAGAGTTDRTASGPRPRVVLVAGSGGRFSGRSTRTRKAYFYTSQDARRAINALRATTATTGEAQPLEQPQTGRAWSVEIDVEPGDSSDRYPNPMLVDEVLTVVFRLGGNHDGPATGRRNYNSASRGGRCRRRPTGRLTDRTHSGAGSSMSAATLRSD